MVKLCIDYLISNSTLLKLFSEAYTDCVLEKRIVLWSSTLYLDVFLKQHCIKLYF